MFPAPATDQEHRLIQSFDQELIHWMHLIRSNTASLIDKHEVHLITSDLMQVIHAQPHKNNPRPWYPLQTWQMCPCGWKIWSGDQRLIQVFTESIQTNDGFILELILGLIHSIVNMAIKCPRNEKSMFRPKLIMMVVGGSIQIGCWKEKTHRTFNLLCGNFWWKIHMFPIGTRMNPQSMAEWTPYEG